MQFIFFVSPNEELEGTLHPQKFGCTPKNEGKRVHVPPDEKTCGHTACKEDWVTEKDSVFVNGSAMMRQDGIKYHEVSDRHKRVIEKKLALFGLVKYGSDK